MVPDPSFPETQNNGEAQDESGQYPLPPPPKSQQYQMPTRPTGFGQALPNRGPTGFESAATPAFPPRPAANFNAGLPNRGPTGFENGMMAPPNRGPTGFESAGLPSRGPTGFEANMMAPPNRMPMPQVNGATFPTAQIGGTLPTNGTFEEEEETVVDDAPPPADFSNYFGDQAPVDEPVEDVAPEPATDYFGEPADVAAPQQVDEDAWGVDPPADEVQEDAWGGDDGWGLDPEGGAEEQSEQGSAPGAFDGVSSYFGQEPSAEPIAEEAAGEKRVSDISTAYFGAPADEMPQEQAEEPTAAAAALPTEEDPVVERTPELAVEENAQPDTTTTDPNVAAVVPVAREQSPPPPAEGGFSAYFDAPAATDNEEQVDENPEKQETEETTNQPAESVMVEEPTDLEHSSSETPAPLVPEEDAWGSMEADPETQQTEPEQQPTDDVWGHPVEDVAQPAVEEDAWGAVDEPVVEDQPIDDAWGAADSSANPEQDAWGSMDASVAEADQVNEQPADEDAWGAVETGPEEQEKEEQKEEEQDEEEAPVFSLSMNDAKSVAEPLDADQPTDDQQEADVTQAAEAVKPANDAELGAQDDQPVEESQPSDDQVAQPAEEDAWGAMDGAVVEDQPEPIEDAWGAAESMQEPTQPVEDAWGSMDAPAEQAAEVDAKPSGEDDGWGAMDGAEEEAADAEPAEEDAWGAMDDAPTPEPVGEAVNEETAVSEEPAAEDAWGSEDAAVEAPLSSHPSDDARPEQEPLVEDVWGDDDTGKDQKDAPEEGVWGASEDKTESVSAEEDGWGDDDAWGKIDDDSNDDAGVNDDGGDKENPESEPVEPATGETPVTDVGRFEVAEAEEQEVVVDSATAPEQTKEQQQAGEAAKRKEGRAAALAAMRRNKQEAAALKKNEAQEAAHDAEREEFQQVRKQLEAEVADLKLRLEGSCSAVELEESRARASALEQSVEGLSTQLGEAKARNDQLLASNADLEASLKASTERFELLDKEKSELAAGLEGTKASLQVLRAELETARAEAAARSVDEEVETMRKDLTKALKRVDHSKAAVKILNRTKRANMESIKQLEAQIAEIKAGGLQEKIDQLTADAAKHNAAMETLSKELEDARAHANSSTTSSQAGNDAALEQQNKQLQEKVQQLQADLASAAQQGDGGSTEEEVVKLREKLGRAVAGFQKAKALCVEMKSKNVAAQQEIEELNQQLSQKPAVAATEEEAPAAKPASSGWDDWGEEESNDNSNGGDDDGRLAELEQKLSRAEASATDSAQQVAELTSAHEEAISDLRAQLALAEKELSQVREDKQLQGANVESFQEEVDALKELVEQLESDKKGLQDQLAAVPPSAAAPRSDSGDLERKLLESQQAKQSLQGQLEEAQMQLSETQTQLADAKAAAPAPGVNTQALEQKLLRTNARIERLHERCLLLNEGVKERETFISLLQARYDEAEKEKTNLKAEQEAKDKKAKEEKAAAAGSSWGFFKGKKEDKNEKPEGAVWNGREWVVEKEGPVLPPLPPRPPAIRLPESPSESPATSPRAGPAMGSAFPNSSSYSSMDSMLPPARGQSAPVSRSTSATSLPNNRFSAARGGRYLDPFGMGGGKPSNAGATPAPMMPSIPGAGNIFAPSLPTPGEDLSAEGTPVADKPADGEAKATMPKPTAAKPMPMPRASPAQSNNNASSVQKQLDDALAKLAEYEAEEANDATLDDKKLLETIRQLRRKLARTSKLLTNANKRLRTLETGSSAAPTPTTSTPATPSTPHTPGAGGATTAKLAQLKMESQLVQAQLTEQLTNVNARLKNVTAHRDELLGKLSTQPEAAANHTNTSAASSEHSAQVARLTSQLEAANARIQELETAAKAGPPASATAGDEVESLRKQLSEAQKLLKDADADVKVDKNPAVANRQLQRKLLRVNKQLASANARVRALEAVSTEKSMVSVNGSPAGMPNVTPKLAMPPATGPAMPGAGPGTNGPKQDSEKTTKLEKELSQLRADLQAARARIGQLEKDLAQSRAVNKQNTSVPTQQLGHPRMPGMLGAQQPPTMLPRQPNAAAPMPRAPGSAPNASVVSREQASYHTRLVKENAQLRNLIQICSRKIAAEAAANLKTNLPPKTTKSLAPGRRRARTLTASELSAPEWAGKLNKALTRIQGHLPKDGQLIVSGGRSSSSPCGVVAQASITSVLLGAAAVAYASLDI